MYAYFATAAASGATIKAIKCKLVKDSFKEYIACLKNHSLEVYSLSDNLIESNEYGNDKSNLPTLTTTLNANSTFVNFIEYRPPGENQTHLLVLTHNYTLLLLTYDDVQSKFVSRSVASLQDDFSTPKYGNIIFKVDSGYNILLFYGHSMVIKCIVLNKKNYFNFTDIVTMRTNDSLFLDIEFMSVEYKSSSKSKSGNEFNSVSFTGSLNKDMQFKSPSKNSSIEYLECKLLILGQDTNSSLHDEPVRWLYGMQLFFEIEILNEYKRFNSYIHLPLLGDQFNLSNPYNRFVPLCLNNKTKQIDSVIMLGPGSIGYSSFKNPKELKNFKVDYSITEITCYVKYGENKYVFGDDNGSLYMMELYLSSSNIGTGLKRRVSSSSSSSTVYTSKSPRELMVSDVVVNRIGKCSVPSSIVKIDENRVFCTSKMGDSCTIQINSSENYDEYKTEEYKEWTHTNLGPITDFVHIEDTVDGTRSILACCGIGNSGSLCKIYLGLASDNLFSSEVTGIQNLFCVLLNNSSDVVDNGNKNNSNSSTSNTGSSMKDNSSSSRFGVNRVRKYSVLCLSFYRFTQFYLVNLSSLRSKDKNKKVSILDNDESRFGEISKLDKEVLIYDENTLLFKKLKNCYMIQVTSTNVLVVDEKFNLAKRVEVSKLLNQSRFRNNKDKEKDRGGKEQKYKEKNDLDSSDKEDENTEDKSKNNRTVVVSLLCGYYVLLVLSDNSLLLLDYNLNVVKSKRLELSISSVTYISREDLDDSLLKHYKGSKNSNLNLEGILAVSSWENSILLLSLKELEVLHVHRINTNFGSFVNSMKFVKVGLEVYLLVGVSDGKLYVYNISEYDAYNNDNNVMNVDNKDGINNSNSRHGNNSNNSKNESNNNSLRFKLDNMFEMTNKSFKLLEINRYIEEDTCDLEKVNIITTGQKCNIFYMGNNKIEYAKTNLTNLTALTTLSTGYRYSGLKEYYNGNSNNNNTNNRDGMNKKNKDNSKNGNTNGYNTSDYDDELLVVYYDNKNLFISKLNMVKNMNLQRVLSGRSFNKVVYHNKSKLAVLSTVPQYLVDPNNMKYNINKNNNNNNNNTDGRNYGNYIQDNEKQKDKDKEGRMGGKGRTRETTRLIEGTQEDTNILMSIDENEVLDKGNTLKIPSCIMLVDLENKEITYTMNLMEEHQVSSLINFNHKGVEYVVVGTARVLEVDEEPIEGFLYILEIDSDDNSDSYRIKVQKTSEPFEGGVVELTSFNDMLVVAVNSTVLLMKPNLKGSFNLGMKRDRIEVEEGRGGGSQKRVEINLSGNRKVYKLEYVNNRNDNRGGENRLREDNGEEVYEQENYLEIITSYECNTYVVSMDTYGDTLLVGDLMTSVKMLKFKDNYLYEVCRDFKTLWTTSLVAIDENKCLVSDDSGNFIVFSSAKKPVNDQQSIQFESLGLFHHGEIVNKMLKYKKKQTKSIETNGYMASKLGKKSYTCNRTFCCQKVKSEPEQVKQKKYTNLFENMYTCVTSSGSILQVCFFDDLKLFLKLSVLEQTMLMIQSEIGNNFNRNHRNYQNLHKNTYSKGFLDGDLIESFLKLPDSLKKKVFNSMLIHINNIDLELNTLDNLVSDIENIRQSRLQ